MHKKRGAAGAKGAHNVRKMNKRGDEMREKGAKKGRVPLKYAKN